MSLEKIITIILNKHYDNEKLETNISFNILKDLLYLCRKRVHVSYNDKIYIQIDGFAIASPMGPLLQTIFDISGKIPSLKIDVAHWRRYVNDTHTFTELSKIKHDLEKLNVHNP